jgi:1,4-alpha-glucan branching enzyme
MIRLLLSLFVFALSFAEINAQLLSWSPAFPKDNDNVVITVDASKGNQGLLNYSPSSDIYVHTGVITNLSTSATDWKYSKFTWGTATAAAQASYLGNNKWQFTITNIRAFFNAPSGVPAGETIKKIAILFRNGTGSTVQRNTDGSDMYIPVYDNAVAVRFSEPFFQPTNVPVPEPINKQVGENINVTAISNISSNMKLYFNGTQIQSANGVTTISANPTITAAGNQEIAAEAFANGTFKYDTLRFYAANAPVIGALPAGVKDGINYHPGNTSVTLVLYAPGKNRVSVIGEFTGSNWVEQTAYQMNKTPDGNYWWITINGLTAGTEYAFQYLVDGSLKTGDPYAEKILDPGNDNSISSGTYPGLKQYPAGASGIVSVLQTAEPGYTWQNNTFTRPDKKSLVIYELLMRDFIDNHDWNTLRDTLNYLKNLGVNAIEIMPLNEFDGNKSWGYNPSYFLAPDKYYGPKNTLKRLIDSCHSKGIAVIMDIALNHATGSCPLAALYWNGSANAPAANNPWFNTAATHPFSVFNDFNHESLQTRYFTSRVVEHWLTQYKIDGFRFDLSKGFTQTNTGTNVGAWSAYDASRIAIWKRYYDTMQLKAPGSIAILEHFADNTEEVELSNYGMLLWGNNTFNFQEAAMGFLTNSNFEGNLFTARNWAQPHLVGYMESHDEERIMYKNLQFGNSSGSYNTRDLNTALKRVEICAAFFLNMPGPKMIWQFGESGYDFSINRCTDGTVNSNCRLDPKPIRWDYLSEIPRKRVYDIYSSVNKLRAHPLFKNNFTSNRVTGSLGAAFKWLQVTTDTSNICVIGNFDVNAATGSVTFQNAGTWYDYLNGGTFTATGGAQNITLQPGEYHVYVNRNVVNAVTTPVSSVSVNNNLLQARIYPNPAGRTSMIEFNLAKRTNVLIEIYNQMGQKLNSIQNGILPKGKQNLPLFTANSKLKPGAGYFVKIITSDEIASVKFVVLH